MHNIKISGFKIEIQFNKSISVEEPNNYVTKIVNAFITCDLDNRPKILLKNCKLKNCLFGATNITKNSDKSKNVYSCNGIGFDGSGSWSFCNNFADKVLIFGTNNISSSHVGDFQNNFLLLSEGPTY